MTDLGFLHGVKVELFGEAEGVEAVVACVGSVEGGGAGEEGDGDGVGGVGISATVVNFCGGRLELCVLGEICDGRKFEGSRQFKFKKLQLI